MHRTEYNDETITGMGYEVTGYSTSSLDPPVYNAYPHTLRWYEHLFRVSLHVLELLQVFAT